MKNDYLCTFCLVIGMLLMAVLHKCSGAPQPETCTCDCLPQIVETRDCRWEIQEIHRLNVIVSIIEARWPHVFVHLRRTPVQLQTKWPEEVPGDGERNKE